MIMGTNPFISHRMFVAALQGDGPAPTKPSTDSVPGGTVKRTTGNGQPQVDAESLATLASQHWSDFPFARNLGRSAS